MGPAFWAHGIFDTNENKHREPQMVQVTMGGTEEILAMNLKR